MMGRRQQIAGRWRRPRTPGAPRATAGRGSARRRSRLACARGLSPIPCRLVEWSVCAVDMARGGQSISRFNESYHDHGERMYLVSVPDIVSEDIDESINMGPSIDQASIEV